MKYLSRGEYTSTNQKLVEEIKYLTWIADNTTPDNINLIWNGSSNRKEYPFKG